MRSRHLRSVVCGGSLCLLMAGALVHGQSATQSPSHKHYTEDKDAGARASRRAARTPAAESRQPHLSGHDAVAGRAAVHQPGPEPVVRLQPCGGGPRVPRGGAPRPRMRDGVLGPGSRARAEHQRHDGPDGRADRPTSSRRRRVALKANASERERAYIDALAQRYSGNADDRAASDRPMPTAMREVVAAVSGRSRRRHALHRVGDGPAAVGLLDARRHNRTTAPRRSWR